MQRYTVFSNDRAVKIEQDCQKPSDALNEMCVDFTGKSSLAEAFSRFCRDSNYRGLTIKAEKNFSEACQSFNSLFTRIEAAGGIVRNLQQEYLFIKRLGVWDLPKGKLHQNEPAAMGALREVSEETGLVNLSISRQLPSTFHIYTDRKGVELLKETYWYEMLCPEPQSLVPQLEEDITEVKWFPADGLNLPLQNTYASLRLLLESYIREQANV